MIRTVGLAVVVLLGLAAQAGACSCVARAPADRMAGADAAFIGKVTAIRREEAKGSTPTFVRHVRVYTVAVEEVHKGDVGATAEVRGEDPDAGSFTSCGVFLDVGDELGGYFEGEPADWFIHTCNAASREDLEKGSQGFPAPRGEGEAVALLSGPFGSSTFAALDARGRVIAYAEGKGTGNAVWLSACPGGDRLVESTFGALRTRRISDLAILRRTSTRVTQVRCADAAGANVIAARGDQLVSIRRGRVRPLTRETERVAPGPRVSLALRRGRVLRVDSRTGRTRRLLDAREPADLSVSPDGARLAVIAARRLTMYAASGRRLAVTRTAGGSETIAWDGRRAIAMPLHRRGGDVVGGKLWWARGGTLRSASSARGESRVIGKVPDADGATVVALPSPVQVRDPARFNPSASAGSRPRARRARAGEGAPRGDCPRA